MVSTNQGCLAAPSHFSFYSLGQEHCHFPSRPRRQMPANARPGLRSGLENMWAAALVLWLVRPSSSVAPVLPSSRRRWCRIRGWCGRNGTGLKPAAELSNAYRTHADAVLQTMKRRGELGPHLVRVKGHYGPKAQYTSVDWKRALGNYSRGCSSQPAPCRAPPPRKYGSVIQLLYLVSFLYISCRMNKTCLLGK